MLWFKSKNKDKVTEVTCPPSDVCKVMDCRLDDLRNNQVAQEVIKERISVLKKKYFPMVYWWIVICYKVGKRMYFKPEHMCRGDIENVLQMTIGILKGSESWYAQNVLKINDFSKFNVDQFCQEMKDYFTAEKQIAELKKELNKLVESEKKIKEILGIK